MGMIRSFVAVPVLEMPEIEHFAREMGKIRGIRGVRAENIHLTLKFLGDIDEERDVPEIIDLLTQVTRRHSPLEVRFSGVGAFPNMNNMRVAWIGMESPELSALAEDIITTLPKKQDEKPQSFRAHLTIGRIKFHEGAKNGRQLLERYLDHEFGSLNVEGFHLMQSTLTPQGPIYNVLKDFSFP